MGGYTERKQIEQIGVADPCGVHDIHKGFSQALDDYDTSRYVSKDTATSASSDDSNEFDHHILEYINMNFDDPNISLKDIAEHFNINASNVSRKFQHSTGEHFRSYLMGLRIKKACSLLLETDESVNAIGKMAGYENPASFRRIFKQMMGLSPSDVRIDFCIPHSPVSRQRAQVLMDQDFEARLTECIAYWEQKESQGAQISVPEKTVNEMIRAGLFHLDISTYGLEPGGTLSPTIGVYSALASESWPIVLYFESMGLHDVAGRCIRYFYDKQHEDGFMQNFGQYMLETGAALWFTAEHFYHTRDEQWLRDIMPGIKKAVDYLLAWRERNKREELRGRGYGMLEGRSSDTPDDEQRMFAQFIMNYHCEMMYIKNVRTSQPYYSRHPYLHLLRGEAKAFIRNYYNGLTSLADWETYSIWEHYFHASPHKTHEEGCFLMESRWMLYLEDGDSLRLLMGAPSRWMDAGKKITVTDASSHFGHLSLTAWSRLDEGVIQVDISFADPSRLPREIVLRIPHPLGEEPVGIDGGNYDKERRCVVVNPAEQNIHVTARFV